MTEFDVMAKDYIKLGFLNEVVNQKSVVFSVFLESEGNEKNFLDIRTDKNVYRFNNFNVSEDATKNIITFRPIVIGCYSYFKIVNSVPFALDVIKNGTTTVAKRFILAPGENKIEFEPQGMQKYVMKMNENVSASDNGASENSPANVEQMSVEDSAINPFDSPFSSGMDFGTFSTIEPTQPVMPPVSSVDSEEVKRKEQLLQSNSRLEADISSIQQEINELEAKNEQLVNNKENLISHLEKLQAEYDKDYASYEAGIEEIKSKYTIDDEILRMYADKEVTPIEELLVRSENDIKEIEEQARIFIEAQQRKTAEIESELKIGKKDN